MFEGVDDMWCTSQQFLVRGEIILVVFTVPLRLRGIATWCWMYGYIESHMPAEIQYVCKQEVSRDSCCELFALLLLYPANPSVVRIA